MIGTAVFHQKQGISKLLANLRQQEWFAKTRVFFLNLHFYKTEKVIKPSRDHTKIAEKYLSIIM